jgi:hypothetical protein
LSGAYFPTGSIVFTLIGPGGFAFTETETVNGNGAYTLTVTLPTTGTVPGTYVWSVTYGGDANNLGEFASPEPVFVGGVPEVPEPSTWMMMGLGFAGLGFAASGRQALSLTSVRAKSSPT